MERSIDLAVILTSAFDGTDLLIGERLHELLELRGVLHPMLADEIARRYRVHLVIAVHGLLHSFLQHSAFIPGEDPVPAPAPDHLDHMPVGTAKRTLQLLNDFAVATHGTVKALEVTVDDQHEVVQCFAARNVDCAEYLWLIRFAIADESPDLAPVVRLQPPAFQILRKTCLVDGAGRGKPHARGRHLPEPG